MKSVFLWIITNGIFAASLYFGFVEDSVGALNIAQFIAWFTIVTSFLLISEAAVNARVKQGKPFSVPMIVDIIYDILIVGIFVWFGWFWTAAFYTLHIFLLMNYREAVEKKIVNLTKEK